MVWTLKANGKQEPDCDLAPASPSLLQDIQRKAPHLVLPQPAMKSDVHIQMSLSETSSDIFYFFFRAFWYPVDLLLSALIYDKTPLLGNHIYESL